MVFHESLNPERKFSLAIPLVFIAILGGTTAVLEVATVLSPQSSYAVNARSQLAEGAAPVGGDKDACQAGHIYEVIVDAKATVKTEDVGKKVDCEAKDAQGKKINQGHVMCSGGKGEGFGRDSYLLPTGSSNSVECLPGEDVTKTGLNDARAAAAAQYKTSTKLLQEGMGFDENIGDTSFPNPAGNVDNNLKNQDRALRDYQILSQALGDQTPINSPTISQTPDVNNAIKGYGGESDTPIPDDYQGENPGAIDAALKNSASYLGPTSPGLSQSDLLRMPLDQLNGDYKYGDITVSTDGREYSVSQDGERIAVIKEVREGQTVADVIADKQYYNGPESPYQSSRDTFAANVVAQGEVPYSSARGTPEQTDTSAFDKWSAGLPGANIQGPAYDFNSDALDRSVAKDVGDLKGGWAAATTEQQLENCAYGGCSDEFVRDLRNTRIQELENEKNEIEVANAGAGMSIGGDFSDAKQKELDELKTLNAPTETSTPTPKKDGGIIPGTDQPGLDCSKGGCVDARGNPIPATTPAPKPGDGADTGGKGEVTKANTPPVPGVECAGSSRGCTPTAKTPIDPNGNQTGAGRTGGGDPTKDNSGSGSGIGSALSSMLQGLMKALGAPPPPAAPAQACATDQH